MTEHQILSYGATVFFALAVLHTFSVKFFQRLAGRFPEGSAGENLFHLLGEVEIVFGIWAGIFILYFAVVAGFGKQIEYLQSRNFTEPIFVYAIMTISATRPILLICEKVIRFQGRILPINRALGFYFATLTVGPLLGSFITEPAAMTVTSLILFKSFYQGGISTRLKYATLGLLFVNISIGGTLTPFAAPPVLMVAAKWNWDFVFMFTHFGWKAIIAVILSTGLVTYRFRNEISKYQENVDATQLPKTPTWVTILHLLVLLGTVLSAHYVVLFMGLFLFFLGIATVTREYQDELKIREALLVGFFLGGLVILGGYQAWWLEPILSKLSALPLYLGSMGLTSITDNAAITYLGSQVPGLSDFSKYALVAGSVVGGGLTVIANAPNPAGYNTLNPAFGKDGISPILLFTNALVPTGIAALCFWLL